MYLTNRRNFLRTSVAAAGVGALNRGSFAADDTKPRQQIDCHTHFFRRDITGTRFEGKETPADLKAVASPVGVTGTVVVEASPKVEDNQWLLDLAKGDPFVVGVVGNLAPGDTDFATHLDRFTKYELFRGIRINSEQLTASLAQQSLIDNLKRLVDHDLALDVNGGPEMPADVARLAEKLPQLRMVVNHAANQDIDGKAPPKSWVASMKEAAAHPNVFCKVSALVDQNGWQGGKAPADVSFYKPLLDSIWDIFGEDRLIFGSNWPVSEQFATYKVVYGIMDDYLKTKTSPARGKYFAANSQVAYRWRGSNNE